MTAHRLQTARLAVDGGQPVRPAGRRWPAWPVPAEDAERLLISVLHSRRWAISSPEGSDLFERRFASMFADYAGARHCIPVDHGSSALVIALEALGLDYGDAVLVPALTWTASATAVLRAGLVPILVDVDRRTGCVRPEDLDVDVEARAVIAVHWACAMADVPAIGAVAAARGMTVIEDCAQAHGARWRGRSAGTMGRLGCFSFQHGKVLTCGEGGAVVTDDDELAPVLEELRADSRRYRSDRAPRGHLDLVETASIMGANFCLNEFGAAVLCAQLGTLDAQHQIRNRNHALLTGLISGIPGVRLLQPAPEQTTMSMYEPTIVFERLPAGMTNQQVAAALTAELGARVYVTDDPLHRSRLLQPGTKPALAPLARRFVEYHHGRRYPNTDHLADHSVQVHHRVFLGGEEDMADVAGAIEKVVASREDGDV
jgi:L-glutamine:2-deoxy-scyllo-inosose/3-amino-2,3-dideoxy-scyllo-inosose aminotransferase